MITIDLNNTYGLASSFVDTRKSIGEFYAPQIGGGNRLMRIIIKPHPDPLLYKVYNLSMGPPISNDQVDDKTRLKHCDSSRVFSTVMLFAFTFLEAYPDLHVGLDGSDDLRATLYHSMFISNRKTMDEIFISIGVDWYVKLLRNRADIERTAEGVPHFKPRSEPFDYHRYRHELYSYYLLKQKNK